MQFQKVLHLEDELAKKKPKLSGEFLISTKLDGWFVAIPFSNGAWNYPVSSRGRVIPSLSWVRDKLNATSFIPKKEGFFVAEAIIPDTPFHITNGILNRSVGDFLCHDVELHAHDLVYSNNFADASARYTSLAAIDVQQMLPNFHLHPVLATAEYSKDTWQRYFELAVTTGNEGIVAKRVDSYYSFGKRNSDLLKLKLECSKDCLAVRLEEGFGERGNDSLTLVSQRANGTEIRTVISKHSDKALFRSNPSEVIGKVVEIKGMEELSDGNLRQPVFYCIREDKLISEID